MMQRIQKTFSACLENLHPMLDFIKDYAIESKAPSGIVEQIILGSEEALVNVIHYAYPKKGDLNEIDATIEIVCEPTDPQEGMRIRIKDQGVAFDPIKKANEADVLSKDRLGGYGTLLVLRLMDKVEYQRKEDSNVLVLTKYFLGSL